MVRIDPVPENPVLVLRRWQTSRPRRETHLPRRRWTQCVLLADDAVHPGLLRWLGGILLSEKGRLWQRVCPYAYERVHACSRPTFYRAIRLPGGDSGSRYSSSSGVLDTIASVPYFVIGLAGIAYEWVAEKFDAIAIRLQGRRGYRNLPVDEDAQILRFEDEES